MLAFPPMNATQPPSPGSSGKREFFPDQPVMEARADIATLLPMVGITPEW